MVLHISLVSGWLCITMFRICLARRAWHAEFSLAPMPSTAPQDVCSCCLVRSFNAHHVLEWYGEKRIKHWRKERQKCCDVKDRDGIKHAQEMMISWRHYLRVLQGIVHNFCDEEPGESAADRLRRYQDCSLSECSDPSYWPEVYHGTTDELSDEDLWRTM